MQDFLDVSKIPAKGAITGILGATTIVAGIAAFNPQLAGIIFFGMLIVALATAKFIWIRSIIRKRRAKSMTGELNQQSAAAPAGVSDVSKRAKLDQLRQKFGEGLAKFGNAQNIYKFPWYVIVGEPGSGKTEAIRHSNVGFPPGMQDELQGAGGTINMNWWFTNQAVFLDTAGKLMFEEVKPGESNEWKEFLQLLARNRPNCPINGLLLIIPTDALIKDTDAELNRKAGRIAAQFELIQRTLDIRFPVFVMITKCDMMSGFREFFDDFADAQSVNQMLGWSNPEERDAPFQADRVTDHLATVVQRIKKRRLSLLRDPVPQKGEERRTDEVDALYSLPQSIQLLAPRLRQYLEQIFVAGPWAPKPLFLRGIYFTSSMREGAALDQELAQALGLGADQLSEAKVWEKERAYFLRDIFTEKVFRERGLVTRATDTKRMLRKRGLIVWGTASLLALTFIGFTVYAYRQFADSIKQHSELWAAAKIPADWKDGRWKPIVSPEKPGATAARFRGTEPPVKVGETGIPLLAYHEQLRVVATKPIEAGWVFRPVLKAAKLDADRLKAQRLVYEASVIYPLVHAARYRMQNEAIENADDAGAAADVRLEREARALNALLRIEADQVAPKSKKQSEEIAEAVLLPLVRYVTVTKEPAAPEKLKLFGETFTATYTANPAAQWVPKRLPLSYASLVENPPIAAGLRRFKVLAGDTVRGQRESATKIVHMRDDLHEFRRIERLMETTPSGLGEQKDKEEALNTLLKQLTVTKEATDAKLKTAKDENLLVGDKAMMYSTYQQLVSGSQGSSKASFQLVRDAIAPLVPNDKAKLFKEVDEELKTTLTGLTEEVQKTFSAPEIEDLKKLDPYLEDFGDNHPIYTVRFDTYREAAALAKQTDDLKHEFIGEGWASFGKILAEIDRLKEQLPARQGQFGSPNLSKPCEAFLKIAKDRRLTAIAQAYLDQTRDKLEAVFGEPFVTGGRGRMTEGQKTEAEALMGKWKRDFSAPEFQSVEPAIKNKLNSLLSDFDAMKAAGDAYDQYVRRFAGLRVQIRLTDPGAYKFHIVEGGGAAANIFKGQSFSTEAKYGESIKISLTDPVNGRHAEGSINTRGGGIQSISRDGDTLRFSVQVIGEVPQAPPSGPKKSSVLAKLR